VSPLLEFLRDWKYFFNDQLSINLYCFTGICQTVFGKPVAGAKNQQVISESTQWASASDLKSRRYYFHTYHDRSVKMIDLNELDLNAQSIKGIRNIQKPGQIINLSSEINNTVFKAISIEQILQLQKQKAAP
jgi:hypothetical protein